MKKETCIQHHIEGTVFCPKCIKDIKEVGKKEVKEQILKEIDKVLSKVMMEFPDTDVGVFNLTYARLKKTLK